MKKENKILIMTGVIMAMLLSALDQTIVSTAMPEIVRELNGLLHLSWVFTAYMLASTVTVPIYGKLSDIYGRKGLFIIGIIIFLAGSALSGMANGMTQLIIFRALQGIGGGAIMVNAFAIIGDIFPPAERGRWQGLIGGVFGLASVAGPLLGGWITDHMSWRWVFYVNIPIGILTILILASAMPKIVHDLRNRSIDYLGSLFITTGLVPFLLALIWGGNEYAWDSWQIISLLGVFTFSLMAFILTESKVKDPILSLSLFRNRAFLASVLSVFLTAMGMFGAILYVPLFAQSIIGVSATNSGMILTPMMISLVITSIISGFIISKSGKYKTMTILGAFIATIGMYLFSKIDIDTTVIGLSLNMVVLGIGLGITMPVFTIVVQSAFDHSRLGEVTAATQLFRNIGGTVGTAVLGSIMNSQLALRLANIKDDSFLQLANKMNLGLNLEKIDVNMMQGLLTPASQEGLRAALLKAPIAMQDKLLTSFDYFMKAIKFGFTQSMNSVYLVGTLLMFASFCVAFFLPEIVLRKSKRSAIEEAGVELDLELGQSDAKHEPAL